MRQKAGASYSVADPQNKEHNRRHPEIERRGKARKRLEIPRGKRSSNKDG